MTRWCGLWGLCGLCGFWGLCGYCGLCGWTELEPTDNSNNQIYVLLLLRLTLISSFIFYKIFCHYEKWNTWNLKENKIYVKNINFGDWFPVDSIGSRFKSRELPFSNPDSFKKKINQNFLNKDNILFLCNSLCNNLISCFNF